MNTTPFSVSSPRELSDFTSFIPSIHSRPVKFLGRIIDGSISDRKSLHELEKKLLDGLNIIDTSHFTGSQKLWFLQHLLIPCIQWPILIYEVPISLAFKLEQKASVHIRKWLKLPKSITSLSFYSSALPCPLPVRSLTSVLKSSKISRHLLLKYSQDPSVSSCVPKLQAGHWQVEEAVQACETDPRHKSIIGHHQHSRYGLGYIKSSKIPSNKSSRDYRTFISNHHKEIDDTYAISKAVQLKVQGQWTRWVNYIQQNFSWKSLLAMPVNLSSFCISSTYDTLPSPSNLKRWKLTTEASCFLCNKDTCTTSHILGACKVALSQGRFTFRHDNVLRIIITNIRSSITNIKSTVPTSKQPIKIKFVKKGTRVKNKNSSPSRILHQASGWVLLGNLDGSFSFPSHIAFTELRPDITIFSNKLKRVTLIELTCPCEENMEAWHNVKVNKYMPLKSVIESNGWNVDLFAVEVGTRGYCSRSVLCCFKSLDLRNRTINTTIKQLSMCSMECSFCIWLARNNKAWSSKEIDLSLKTPEDPLVHQNPLSTTSKTNSLKTNSPLPVGFINKGNTCYANAILQVLSVLPSLWIRVSSESSSLSPLLKSITLNMKIKSRSNKPVDPSNFSWALSRKISESCHVPFNFNSQQDAAEVRQFVIEELKGTSVVASDLISNTIRINISCNQCFCFSAKEEKLDMLTIPLSPNINSSLSKFLKPEILESENKWFCPSCNCLTESTRETSIIGSSSTLVIQLSRFSNSHSRLLKDQQVFNCSPELKVPITVEDEVSFSSKYSLVASITHSGTLEQEHYWAVVKDSNTGDWLSCNDKVVQTVPQHSLNNTTSYILFYKKN